MKNKSLFQFSLSALFTMVLAACGSNGGNNDVPTTTATPTITPTPVVETNTTATTPAPEQKTEKPVENVDAQKLDVQPAESAFVGYKHVSKNNSRFLINEDTDGSKPHSADVPVGMNLRNLSPVLDTLVVAEPTMPDENGKMKVGYLEDLDLRAGNWRMTPLTDSTAAASAGNGYGTAGKIPDTIAVENQKNGTFPFMIMNGRNVKDLLEGNSASRNTDNPLNEPRPLYQPQQDRGLENDFNDITRGELEQLKRAAAEAVQGWRDRIAAFQYQTDAQGNITNQHVLDDLRNKLEKEIDSQVYQEGLANLRCYSGNNRTCELGLDLGIQGKRKNDGNDDKRYTVHVATSANGGNTNVTPDDENETKSEYRSYSHMAPANNNTKSDRKAVLENKAENQYFAYTYQTNRTNYTDETMPIGMTAIPKYDANGKLTGFEYVNTTSQYNQTNGAIGSENLARKSRTDLKIADENETASSQLSNTISDTVDGDNYRNGRISYANVARKNLNIAEVYGYRTFPAGADGYRIGEKPNDYKLNNLPLENKQLTKVQYGRVTSALSGHSTFDDFREGLKLDPTGKLETYVVSYGVFGQDGTEDHYFYRGIDSITPEQLKDLSAKTGGVLKYWGHAVSYGLDDKWDGNPESNVAPTAIGNTTVGRFVSGNHAHAVVDLKSGDVHGSIYNAWYNQDVADEARRAGNTDPKAGLYAVDLVKFNGRLATNGNISGTSVYQKDGSTGLFGANLYGSDASEIGGIVASDDKTKDKKWGAVFGGVRVGGGEIQNATNRGGL